VQPTEPETITLLGVDFTNAPVSVRERVSMSNTQALELLRDVSRVRGLTEAAVVSTCNRTEVYTVGTHAAADAVLDQIHARRKAGEAGPVDCHFSRSVGDAAVRHLVEVATGAQSLILGDSFILRQLKQALGVAAEAGTLGPVLSRAFDIAFDTGRLARARTDIGRGEGSLGAVVAAVVRDRGPANPEILLAGAGATARDIARQLTKRRIGRLTIVNRTDEGADALARACGGATLAAPWHTLRAAAQAADVVICATASDVPILHTDSFAGRVPLLVDVGVPRNIQPPAGATCLVIDDLIERQEEARARRERALPAVRTLVDDALQQWRSWVWARPVDALLKGAFAREAEIRHALVAELVSAGWAGDAGDADRLVGKWTGGLLRQHAAELRQWAAAAGARAVEASTR
jgi:glutamyl-tRNA reductase